MDPPVFSIENEIDKLYELEDSVKANFQSANKMVPEVIEYSQECQVYLEKMKTTMNDILDLQKDVEISKEALEELKTFIKDNPDTDPDTIQKTFDEFLEKADDEFIENPAQTQAIENLEEYISPSECNRDEGEMVVTQLTNFNDPVTRRIIEDPVKSRHCNHSYDRASILEYLKRKDKCPKAGCKFKLKKEDLVEDLKLKAELVKLGK